MMIWGKKLDFPQKDGFLSENEGVFRVHFDL
jgi:hypothetical protein